MAISSPLEGEGPQDGRDTRLAQEAGEPKANRWPRLVRDAAEGMRRLPTLTERSLTK